MAKWFGPSFPFYKGNPLLGTSEKVMARQEDHRLIKNDLLQGLMTVKGERWYRPNFGGDIASFLFDQNDLNSRSDLEESIRQQINTFHPRVVVTKIDVLEDTLNGNLVVVNVFGRTDLGRTNSSSLLVTFQVPTAGSVGANAKRIS